MSSDRAELAAHPGVRWVTVVETGRRSGGSTDQVECRESCKRIWSLAQARADDLGAERLAELEVGTVDGTLVLVREGPSIAAAAVEKRAASSVIRYELRRALRARNGDF